MKESIPGGRLLEVSHGLELETNMTPNLDETPFGLQEISA